MHLLLKKLLELYYNKKNVYLCMCVEKLLKNFQAFQEVLGAWYAGGLSLSFWLKAALIRIAN